MASWNAESTFADRRAHAVHLVAAGRRLHVDAEAVVSSFELDYSVDCKRLKRTEHLVAVGLAAGEEVVVGEALDLRGGLGEQRPPEPAMSGRPSSRSLRAVRYSSSHRVLIARKSSRSPASRRRTGDAD